MERRQPEANPPKTEPRRRRHRHGLWWYAFVLAVVLMTLGAAATVGVFIGYMRSLPPIESLENYDPPEATRVYDRHGAMVIGEFKKERRFVTPLREIPEPLRNAFIAVEDERFFIHYGVDVKGVLRAIWVNLKARALRQGASTITQQMTRNVLKDEVGHARTIERKIKEAILAIQIERRYSKDQILEFYLNQIEFSHNAFGVRAAANVYFSKELDQLTISDCAILAGIPKSPPRYNPISNLGNAKARRNLILGMMRNQGRITQAEYEVAVAEEPEVNPGARNTSRYPYFLDALERELRDHYDIDEDYLKRGGLRINATIDPEIQEACLAALRKGLVEVERQWQETKLSRRYAQIKDWGARFRPRQIRLMKITELTTDTIELAAERYHASIERPEWLPFYEPEACVKPGNYLDIYIESIDDDGRVHGRIGHERPVQGSIVVLDVQTGDVLALVGGTNFYDKHLGWFNRAIQGGRQVGSCFKPFVFATAFSEEYGKTVGPNQIINDVPIRYGKDYEPINYEKEYFGATTLVEALEHSRNVATIRLFDYLRPSRALDFIRRFDFTEDGSQWSMPVEISTCLGTFDCSPLQMAAAYQAFANLGVGIRPRYFSTITRSDADNRIAIPTKRYEEQIIDPIAAYQAQYLLRQVVLDGTARSRIGRRFSGGNHPKICGKTGTTNDCRDAWFCGFTPDLVIVCQVGFDTPRPMGPRMTGGRLAGPIWADALEAILATRDDWRLNFEAPPGLELARICAETGKRHSEYCRRHGHKSYLNVPFRRGQAPWQPCDGIGLPAVKGPLGEPIAFGAPDAAGRPAPLPVTN